MKRYLGTHYGYPDANRVCPGGVRRDFSIEASHLRNMVRDELLCMVNDKRKRTDFSLYSPMEVAEHIQRLAPEEASILDGFGLWNEPERKWDPTQPNCGLNGLVSPHEYVRWHIELRAIFKARGIKTKVFLPGPSSGTLGAMAVRRFIETGDDYAMMFYGTRHFEAWGQKDKFIQDPRKFVLEGFRADFATWYERVLEENNNRLRIGLHSYSLYPEDLPVLCNTVFGGMPQIASECGMKSPTMPTEQEQISHMKRTLKVLRGMGVRVVVWMCGTGTQNTVAVYGRPKVEEVLRQLAEGVNF